MANRTVSGALNVWWRCDACHVNVLGAGQWVPPQYLNRAGVDAEKLEIVDDQFRGGTGAKQSSPHHRELAPVTRISPTEVASQSIVA